MSVNGSITSPSRKLHEHEERTPTSSSRSSSITTIEQPHCRLSLRLCLADFLWDGPTGDAAAVNDAKSTFLKHLGLNEKHLYHRDLFLRMKVRFSA